MQQPNPPLKTKNPQHSSSESVKHRLKRAGVVGGGLCADLQPTLSAVPSSAALFTLRVLGFAIPQNRTKAPAPAQARVGTTWASVSHVFAGAPRGCREPGSYTSDVTAVVRTPHPVQKAREGDSSSIPRPLNEGFVVSTSFRCVQGSLSLPCDAK